MIRNGQSEIDTVILRLPDYGREVKNWSRYSFNQQFLVPTSEWSFAVSDEDVTLTSQLLVPGAFVQLVINDFVQCSGFIDRKTIATGSKGTTVTVRGRDILGPVVDATMDTDFKFTAGMTVPQFILAVLLPFGITTLYNSDAFNINVITGYGAGKGGGTSTVQVPQQLTKVNADGTLTLSQTYVPATINNSTTRPDLKTLTLKELKPHSGEGTFAFIQRILARLGLTMWAMADGSGVVVDAPDFKTAPSQNLVHRRQDPSKNNILDGQIVQDITSQPSVIIATGRGNNPTTATAHLRCIMVNELTGLDDSGKPLPAVQNIIDKYKGAKVLPIRKELVPFARPLGDKKITKPFTLKDDESQNLAQLESFTRHEMAKRQMKALQVSYNLVGHTSDGSHPWGVNTNVAVQDEVFGLNETLWVLEKEFTKSNEGTGCSLKLIRPFTLQIGA